MRFPIVLVLAISVAFASGQAAESFHPPATAVEKALDSILKRADRDDEQLDNLLGGRGNRAFHRTVDYSSMLSNPLIAAITAEEKTMVQKDCDGHYRSDDICGLDYSPITCGQDSNGTYLYRTETDGPDAAQISYTGQRNGKPIATYRLVQLAERWKIDGVRCDSGESFNFVKQ